MRSRRRKAMSEPVHLRKRYAPERPDANR
jgi:hypothetical protein